MGSIRKKEEQSQQDRKKTTMNSNIKSKVHKEAEKWSKYLKAMNH